MNTKRPTGLDTAKYGITDSGERTQFETGAVRDTHEGKGRCDLLPLNPIVHMVSKMGVEDSDEWKVVTLLLDYCNDGMVACLSNAIGLLAKLTVKWEDPSYLCDIEDRVFADSLLTLSTRFESGARKYEERNWEKGIPVKSYIDSAIRHMLKHISGWEDEPHLLACYWNVMCCFETLVTNGSMLDGFVFSKDVRPENTATK